MSDENYEYDFSVKGKVPFVRQKGMTCWAAAAAMMHGWHLQQALTTEEAIKFGRGATIDNVPYTTLLKRGKALPYPEFGNFAFGMGMNCATLRSFTEAKFLNLMMTRNSPLMVCALQKNETISHFYVVKRMYSYDGSPAVLVVNDSTYEEPDTEVFFGGLYENMERAAQAATMDKQILYY
jgi:hypothetical protein